MRPNTWLRHGADQVRSSKKHDPNITMFTISGRYPAKNGIDLVIKVVEDDSRALIILVCLPRVDH
jgi:hypothetical protein